MMITGPDLSQALLSIRAGESDATVLPCTVN